MQIVLNEDDIGLMNQYIETSNRLLTLQKQLKEVGVLDRIKESELRLFLGANVDVELQESLHKSFKTTQPSGDSKSSAYTSLVPWLLRKGIEIRSVLSTTHILLKLQSIAFSFWTLCNTNHESMMLMRHSIENGKGFKLYFKDFNSTTYPILIRLMTDLYTFGAFEHLSLNENGQGFSGKILKNGHLNYFFNGFSYELYLRAQLENALHQFGCKNFTIFTGMKIVTKTRDEERIEIHNELDVLAWVNNERLIWIEAKSNSEMAGSLSKYSSLLINLRGGNPNSQQVQHIFVSRGASQGECTKYGGFFERAFIVNENGFASALNTVVKEVLK